MKIPCHQENEPKDTINVGAILTGLRPTHNSAADDPGVSIILCNRVILRADADVDIGIGHVMRLSALGAALVEANSDVLFVYNACPEPLLKKLESYGIKSLPLTSQTKTSCTEALIELARPGDYVAMDGYHFNLNDQKLVKNAGLKLLFLDDFGHCQHYEADLILNQNASARESLYPSVAQHTKLLLGTEYVLLRPEFLKLPKTNFSRGPSDRIDILVTMGGSDAENTTALILTALLQALKPGKIKANLTVVLGAANPNQEHIAKLIAQEKTSTPTTGGRPDIELDLIVNANNMAELMHEQDILISAGGTTVFEAAYLGVANLVLTTADNQDGTADLVEAGAIMSLGKFPNTGTEQIATVLKTLIESDLLQKMPKIARSLVDGQGVQRVIAAMRDTEA
ncbi:MAG: UDP-2,4-diacetamido-2,4,6-trideoxy-beta-L-altropyranose hydrolase [Candidatus Obscuribacter sp.]|nr:UDP-2,4-diacetamido-2,4,6-trideoxy-beta-L-altropyranose hydrolase [Candidatus Obscuribacter sp.]